VKVKCPGDLPGQVREFVDIWQRRRGSRATVDAMTQSLRAVELVKLAEEIEEIGEKERNKAEADKEGTVQPQRIRRRHRGSELVSSSTTAMSSRAATRNGRANYKDKSILLLYDLEDRISRSFVLNKIQNQRRTSKGTGSVQYIKVARSRGKRNKSAVRQRLASGDLSASYKGVAVVLSGNSLFKSQEDRQLLDRISYEYENGLLTLVCIRLEDNSVIPRQLRCSKTVDFFGDVTEPPCWQKGIWEILEDNSSLHMCSSTGRENAESNCGEQRKDDDLSSPKTHGRHSSGLCTYISFDCRSLSFHRAMNYAECKGVPYTEIVYTILCMQMMAGLICCAVTLHCNLLDTAQRTTNFEFLLLVYFPLRFLFPFVALSRVNSLRSSSNSPFLVKVPQEAYNSIYTTLRNIYNDNDLKGFTVSNAARNGEVKLDQGLTTRICAAIVQSFLVTVTLWLLKVLDIDKPSWLPNVLPASIITVLNFIGTFLSLLIIGVVLTQQSFETMISGYRFVLVQKGVPSDQEYFQQPYDKLRGTWDYLTIAGFVIIFFYSLIDILGQISGRSSFPFQGLDESCQALWLVTTVVIVAADLFSFWADSRMILWGSLPVSCCCLLVLVGSFFYGENQIDCLDSPQAVGHAKHLLLSHLLLVRLMVVFYRSLVLAYHHCRSGFLWTDKEKVVVVMSIVGLVLATYSSRGVGSMLYSVGH
jgi:hypothetical protein